MKAIIVGGGKVGFYLAKTLAEHGHVATVIERRAERCQYIADQLDIPVICADGSTLDALTMARAEEAEALAGVTGRDEDNLIVCQLAKRHFGVARTIARINNPKNVDIMKKLGVDIPVSSTGTLASIIEREIDTSAIKQLLTINRGEGSITEITLPPNFKHNGKTLTQIALPQQSVLVAIYRDGAMLIPRGATVLMAGDRILVVCKDNAFHELVKALGVENRTK